MESDVPVRHQGESLEDNGIWTVSQEIDLIWRWKLQNHTNIMV